MPEGQVKADASLVVPLPIRAARLIPERPRDLVAEVTGARHALAAFNVVNMETVQAVVAAAEDVGSPVLLQISPGAIDYAGYAVITRIAMDAASDAQVPVLVHLDHCRDPGVVVRAIGDGYPSVMFDGSHLSLEDNVSTTVDIVQRARSRGTVVEAELGVIGGRESMTVAEARSKATTPEEAASFVAATQVDILAPALGSVHRMPDDSVSLDLRLIQKLSAAARRPLALHGGSGIRRDELAGAIAAGIGKVNISSRIGRAFAAGIQSTWRSDPEQMDPRRFLGMAREHARETAHEYLIICGAGQGGRRRKPTWSDEVRESE